MGFERFVLAGFSDTSRINGRSLRKDCETDILSTVKWSGNCGLTPQLFHYIYRKKRWKNGILNIEYEVR